MAEQETQGTTELKLLTKEEFGTVIAEQIDASAERQRIAMNDSIRGTVKELIEDAIRDVGTVDKRKVLDPADDPKAGYKCMAEFAYDVWAAGPAGRNISSRLQEWDNKSRAKAVGSPSQSVGQPDEGGYLIPPEYSSEILRRAVERTNILNLCRIVPMGSNAINIPFIKGFNESQGYVAGNVQFVWVAEEEQGTGKNVKLGMVELRLKKAMALAYVTGEMMKFSPQSIDPFVTGGFEDAAVREMSRVCIRGLGAGQPLGILKSNALISVAKETEQAADTIQYENILKMFARHYGDTGRWHGNKNIVPQLGLMNVSVGTGGAPVWIPGGNAAGALQNSLLGYPLEYTSLCSTLGDEGDIILADWSQYLVGQEAGGFGMDVQTSAHLKFDYDQNTFRFIFYIDGQPWWKEPFSPENGDTQSPFVTLAARA